jgi:outer membrane lipoprotein-sorting protein
MRTILCIYALLCFSATGVCQDPSALVQRVKARLDRVNDYEAKGKMTLDVSFIDAPQSDVTVYYKKPNKFKVKKQGGISILPKGGISINLGTILAGQNYDVVGRKDTTINGMLLKVAKLLPQDDNSDMAVATLYIEEKNEVVRKATITTRENGSYDIDLSYGKYIAWGLPDQVVFSFNTRDYKLPKGITIEYEKGDAKKQEPPKNNKGKVQINYSSYSINKGVDDKVFETD